MRVCDDDESDQGWAEATGNRGPGVDNSQQSPGGDRESEHFHRDTDVHQHGPEGDRARSTPFGTEPDG
eukprot:270559-Rhodomonas_salina.1